MSSAVAARSRIGVRRRRPTDPRLPPPPAPATVPRLWPGATIVCLASGPSLTAADVDACRGQTRLVCVNDAYRLAPGADVLYAADATWWKWHRQVPDDQLPPLLFTVSRTAQAWRPSVRVLRSNGRAGISTAPCCVRLAGHSGYQAINVAVHLGAARILLLGYDMQPASTGAHHFFGDHPNQSHVDYRRWLGDYQALKIALDALGIPILNCSRQTAITALPRASLAEALA